MGIIDVRVRLPEELRPKKLSSYQEVYGRYDEVLNVISRGSKTLDELLIEMKDNSVEFAVIHAEYEYGEMADALNEAVYEVISTHPQTFTGFGTTSMNDLRPMKLVKQVETIHQFNLKGVNLQPVFFDVDPLDSKLYPLYATASQLGLIVSFHTGIHYSKKHPIIKNSPLFIDKIACDFPDLKIIACHGGWPWINEMVAVARRHSNVFIEFGGIAPKYIGRAGSGWDPLYQLMNNLLADQILFGTDWPVMSYERALIEWNEIGLKKEVLAKFTSLNARNLLGIE
ncbi:amidohydrolase family protein [Brevibacillus sp. SIMBA_040]|uniref:amidohydrolase family protein n=2 Tax=Bacteria TaxID=2 RepID=UPI00397B37AE